MQALPHRNDPRRDLVTYRLRSQAVIESRDRVLVMVIAHSLVVLSRHTPQRSILLSSTREALRSSAHGVGAEAGGHPSRRSGDHGVLPETPGHDHLRRAVAQQRPSGAALLPGAN